MIYKDTFYTPMCFEHCYLIMFSFSFLGIVHKSSSSLQFLLFYACEIMSQKMVGLCTFFEETSSIFSIISNLKSHRDLTFLVKVVCSFLYNICIAHCCIKQKRKFINSTTYRFMQNAIICTLLIR